MKKIVLSLLFVLGIMGSVMLTNPGEALAMELEINNKIGKTLSVCVVHFDEKRNAWLCEGWWIVKGNSFRAIKLPTHNRPDIWVHMHNVDRSWGDGKAWTVVDDKFCYDIKKSCPEGTNRREVAFNRYDIGQSGTVRLTAK